MDVALPTLSLEYFLNLPSEALSGDVFAVSISLILLYFIVLLINKLTEIIVIFLKKIILLVIVSLAFYQFLILFIERYQIEGATSDVMLFGGFGFLAGCVVLVIAFHTAFSSLRRAGEEAGGVSDEGETEERAEKEKGVEKKFDSKRILSMDALKKDRGLGAVIAYLIVSEFGVISSKTVAAPSVTAGMLFFFAFMIIAIFFVHQSYNNPNTGMRHFVFAFLIGGMLSILLGMFWGGYTMGEMLSEAYFVSDSLVAFVTGMAVSLFMGSKG